MDDKTENPVNKGTTKNVSLYHVTTSCVLDIGLL